MSCKTSADRRAPLTHFLCLPLIIPKSRPQLDESLARFRQQVAALEQTPGISFDAAAIRPVGTLHLTLGVMSLTDEQLNAAIDHLTRLDLSSLDDALTDRSRKIDQRLVVDFTGLESMHKPEDTSILYLPPVDHTNRLYNFCRQLRESFREAGFLVDQNRALRLHATVVNTVHVRKSKRCGNFPPRFDARGILEHFRDCTWANDVVLDRIAICEMGAKKHFGPDGRVLDEKYTETAHRQLPTAATKINNIDQM